MEERLNQRLQNLKQEFDAGQKMLAEINGKQVEIRDTLLRIQGAITILEAELNPDKVNEQANVAVSA